MTSWRSPAGVMPRCRGSPRTSAISDSCLRNWLHAADVEDGNRPGVSVSESAELREMRRRNRLLEQENEVLRRAAAYFAQAHLPG
jgi:transposase